jgi:DNA-binding XRE family transcriptional regulator
VPVQPHTIGEHLKARRLALHRFQSDVAKELGADKASLQNWERGIYDPIPRFYPAIIRFLGYVPFTHDGTPSGMIRWLRCCSGWNQQQLAAAAKCNEVTVWRWETGRPSNTNIRELGIGCLVHRLESLGLAELVRTELETLRWRMH